MGYLLTGGVLAFQAAIFLTIRWAASAGRSYLLAATAGWVLFTIFGSIYTAGLLLLQLVTIFISYKVGNAIVITCATHPISVGNVGANMWAEVVKNIGRSILWSMVAVVVVFVLKTTMQERSTAPKAANVQEMVKKEQANFERVNSAAVAARPDLSPSQAMALASLKETDKILASSSSPHEKLFAAGGLFFAYYFANVNTRFEYCTGLGVDISPFVKAFKAAHVEEYRIAADELARKSFTPEWMEKQMNPLARSVMDQGMQDMARMNNINPKQVCIVFAENPKYFAMEYSLRKKSPATYAALHSSSE